MVCFDWEGNGKKDIVDGFIEYNIYKACSKDEPASWPGHRGGVSTFGAIIATVITLLAFATIVNAIGTDSLLLLGE